MNEFNKLDYYTYPKSQYTLNIELAKIKNIEINLDKYLSDEIVDVFIQYHGATYKLDKEKFFSFIRRFLKEDKNDK